MEGAQEGGREERGDGVWREGRRDGGLEGARGRGRKKVWMEGRGNGGDGGDGEREGRDVFPIYKGSYP